MSGHWIKLNDTRVRVDHVSGQRQDAYFVAWAIMNRFEGAGGLNARQHYTVEESSGVEEDSAAPRTK